VTAMKLKHSAIISNIDFIVGIIIIASKQKQQLGNASIHSRRG
jgi:hypothetical protein